MGSFVPATSASLAKHNVNLPRITRPVGDNTHCFCAHLNILAEVDAGISRERFGLEGWTPRVASWKLCR